MWIPKSHRQTEHRRAWALMFPLLISGCAGIVPPPRAPAAATAPISADISRDTSPKCSIVLYGDSILHGGYAGSKRLVQPPADRLRYLRPRYKVLDLSVNAETARARSARFTQDAQERRDARFVVIAHGINDAAQALPLAEAMTGMVRTAQAEGSTVILTGLSRQPVSVPLRNAYDTVIREVAVRTGAVFADWGAASFDPSQMADVLHPAQPYADRLVERIVAVLDTHAPECR